MLSLKIGVNHFDYGFFLSHFSADKRYSVYAEKHTSALSSMTGNELIMVLINFESDDGIEYAIHSYALNELIHTFIIFYLERMVGKILDIANWNDTHLFTFQIVLSFGHLLSPSLSSFSCVSFVFPRP